MAAGIYNFTIEQGATWTRDFIWTDSSGTAIDLTGYTARMQGRASVQSTATIFSLTSSPAAGIVITAAQGKVTVTLTATETANLPCGGVYDLELVNGAVVTRLVEGSFILSSEITR